MAPSSSASGQSIAAVNIESLLTYTTDYQKTLLANLIIEAI